VRYLPLLLLVACNKQDDSPLPKKQQRTAPAEVYTAPISNYWYNNTLDDSIRVSLTSAIADIDWMDRNRITSSNQYASLYISSSLIRSASFPSAVAYASQRGIRLGLAYSQTSQIDELLAYNNGKPADQKLVYAITELEPWNTGDYAGMTSKMQYATPRLHANGLKHLVYIGWPTSSYYPTIVTNADEVNLHCYRTSDNMNLSGMWGYVQARLNILAQEAANQGKILPVNIIYSCEPAFAYSWFSKHSWKDAHMAFQTVYEQRATQQMKQWLRINNFSIFVTKYAHQIKP